MDESEMIKNLLSVGAELAGSATGGALGFFAAGPIGAAAGAAGGTMLTKIIQKTGEEICSRYLLGEREKVRIGAAAIFALARAEEYIKEGDTLRKDSFFDSNKLERSISEELLEGVLV